MDEAFLECNDLDWFACYQDGQLAHFADGWKRLYTGSSETVNHRL